jgi:hypothetical protein
MISLNMKNVPPFLLWFLLWLSINLVVPSYADDSVDKLISKLEGAIQKEDRSALSGLINTQEISDKSRLQVDRLIDVLLSMKNCNIVAGPVLDSLDRVYTIDEKKCGLNGSYDSTIYFSSKDNPSQGVFIPAGRVIYTGYRLLQPVELQYGHALLGKPGFVVAPTNPGGIATDVRGKEKGEPVRDEYSGRFFLAP